MEPSPRSLSALPPPRPILDKPFLGMPPLLLPLGYYLLFLLLLLRLPLLLLLPSVVFLRQGGGRIGKRRAKDCSRLVNEGTWPQSEACLRPPPHDR